MYWPTLADYKDSIENIETCVRDIDLSKTNPSFLPNGEIETILGSKVIAYHLKNNAKSWAVCCFLEPLEDNENPNLFEEYLSDIWSKIPNNLSLLPNAIKVKNNYYPIIKADWTEDQLAKNNVQTSQLELPASKPTNPLDEKQTGVMEIITQSLLPSENASNFNQTGTIAAQTNIIAVDEIIFDHKSKPNIDIKNNSDLVVPKTQIMSPLEVTEIQLPQSAPSLTLGKKGSDLNFTTQISLEEAFRGTSVSIKIPKLETCVTCQGKLLANGVKCRTCKGQNKIITEKAFNINIPPGIKDGERLCMLGEGEAGIDGAPTGDLYVNVTVRQHHIFQREENDLYHTINITPNQLGQNLSILFLNGQPLIFNIPFEANNDTIIPVIGKGMCSVGQNDPGNLYIRVRLSEYPNNINSIPPPNYQAPSKPNYPNNPNNYQNNYPNNYQDNYQNNYPNNYPNNPNPYREGQAYQNQEQAQRPYMDAYRDPSNDPSRSPYNSPNYYPPQNMQFQNMQFRNVTPYPTYEQSPEKYESLLKQIKTNAMLSFGLSILSLFCLGIIVAPVSFILSRKALNLIKLHNIGIDYKSWATIGQILSIFAFLFNTFVLLWVVFEG